MASLLCPDLVAEHIVTHSLRGEDSPVLQAPLLAPDLMLMAESEGEAALAPLEDEAAVQEVLLECRVEAIHMRTLWQDALQLQLRHKLLLRQQPPVVLIEPLQCLVKDVRCVDGRATRPWVVCQAAVTLQCRSQVVLKSFCSYAQLLPCSSVCQAIKAQKQIITTKYLVLGGFCHGYRN